MAPSELRAELLSHGYAVLQGLHSVEEALSATSTLGALRELSGMAVQTLATRCKEQATSRSFSRLHGMRAFPLHTDTAFWIVPTRYVVLYADRASDAGTTVLCAKALESLIDRSRDQIPIYSRKTVAGHIYSRPWFGREGRFLAYDPCYMKPMNHAAKRFSFAMEDAAERAVTVKWSAHQALVVDNWRCAHGRDPVRHEGRTLMRFYRG
jgi:alpha-ketoglutarate-dependent taurine dioxygenase